MGLGMGSSREEARSSAVVFCVATKRFNDELYNRKVGERESRPLRCARQAGGLEVSRVEPAVADDAADGVALIVGAADVVAILAEDYEVVAGLDGVGLAGIEDVGEGFASGEDGCQTNPGDATAAGWPWM